MLSSFVDVTLNIFLLVLVIMGVVHWCCLKSTVRTWKVRKDNSSVLLSVLAIAASFIMVLFTLIVFTHEKAEMIDAANGSLNPVKCKLVRSWFGPVYLVYEKKATGSD